MASRNPRRMHDQRSLPNHAPHLRVVRAPRPEIQLLPPASPARLHRADVWKLPFASTLGASVAQDGPAALLKRGSDISLAATVLVLSAPLLIAVALVLLVVERQSPFFRDLRVGRDGAQFECWKFRTMRGDWTVLARYLERHPDEAERYATQRKLRNDPRVTRTGRYLRISSIDELPQLLNVLRGEMSLVGPRPLSLREFEQRGWRRWQIVSTRPGLTGLWQVSGRGTTSVRTRAAMDVLYARNCSVGLDLVIVMRTPLQIVKRVGAW